MMKKWMLSLLFLTGTAFFAHAESEYEHWFTGSTLRLDYLFCGDAQSQEIYFCEALKTAPWAGRKTQLDSLILRGNGQIEVRDAESGKLLYVNGFSTLFQEWLSYEEATRLPRSFENSFQVPFPRYPVEITLRLQNSHQQDIATLRHRLDPSDILIRALSDNGIERKQLLYNGEDAIDVVILAEGYRTDEMDKFYHDAERSVAAFLKHEPFKSRQSRFNFTAIAAPSQDSGVSIPHLHTWRKTAVGSHFDTFYSERYLTTVEMRRVYDLIGTVPCEHVIILANTPVYGGGGIFNNVTIMAADTPPFEVVLVHEFGHAFGGLADEYAYDDMYESFYPADTEPWEPNITTLWHFGDKWADLLPSGTTVPTPLDPLELSGDIRRKWTSLSQEERDRLNHAVGVYEGAGYQSRGVYRPVQECRMRINECEDFCPVCLRSLVRLIDFYTGCAK